MRRFCAAVAAVVLTGCASGGVSSAPQKSTTMVSVPVGNGGDQGSVDMVINSYNANAPVVSTLSARRDAVWSALDATYQAIGITVAMRDPANWQMGNRNLQVSRRLNGNSLSRYFNCGNTGMGAEIADSYRLTASVVSTVAEQGAGSRLETVAQAVARQQGTSSPPVNCASTGQLEQEIANRVARAVGG
jgi:hypothetical protein